MLEEDDVLEEEKEEELEEDRGDVFDPDEEGVEEEEESDNEDEDEDDSSEEEIEEGSGEGEDEDDSDEEKDSEEDKEVRIPKGRFDQVLHQRDQEKERVAWLEDQLEVLINNQTIKKEEEKVDEPKYDFSIKEKEYIDFILEGETEKAIGLRQEIDGEKDRQFKKELETYREGAEETAKEIQEQEKFDVLVDSFEQKYNFLNADDDNYNEEAVETVNALTASFVNKDGLTKSQAIKKAVDRVVPMYDKTKKVTKKETLGSREKDSRKRNIKASKQQPPKGSSRGGSDRDLEEVVPSKLSEKDFKNLSAKEKRILRGD